MSDVRTLAVSADEAGLRLDRWFRRRFPGLAHGRLEKLLRTGQVRVDGRRAKAGARLEAGQQVRVPPLGAATAPTAAPVPPRPEVSARDRQALERAVLHIDPAVLVIDKPAGLAVQGGSGTSRHLDAMLDALRFDAPERPRLVHRLDKDTSGVLVLARSARAAQRLARAFQGKAVRKLYWAIVVGVPMPPSGRVDSPLAKGAGRAGERMRVDADEGRRAITDYAVIDRAGRRAAWLALRPVTGRTHQLRVHCMAMDTPILGDGKYGGRAAFLPGVELPKQLHLHARAVRFPHPDGGEVAVEAPPPPHLRETMRVLGFAPSDARDPFADADG